MAELRMRPRFAVELPCDAEAVVRALREGLGRAEPALEGELDPTHCVLRVPAERRAFWSPELDLTFERPGKGNGPAEGVRVRCLFAPRPGVWTGFVFVYALLGCVALAGLLYGLAQLTLGEPPRALVVSAGALAALALVYASTFVGRGLAATQMYELRRALDESLERAAERARAEPRSSFESARL